MANLKDSQNTTGKTVTLSAAQIQFLSNMHAYMQQQLDILMEQMAGMYLNHLSVSEFKMDPNKNYHFEFHPDREYDNLTITEKP